MPRDRRSAATQLAFPITRVESREPIAVGRAVRHALRTGWVPSDLYDCVEGAAWAAVMAERGHGSPTELLALVVSELVQLGDHSDQTIKRMSAEMGFLVRFLDHVGVEMVNDVGVAHLRDFVGGPVRSGSAWADPSLSTQYLRRSSARLFFKTCRRIGCCETDPTENLWLPPRSADLTRPLSDEEIVECRLASRRTLVETRLPASLALAEAMASASERAACRVGDLDLDNGRVWLHDGGRDRTPRWGLLTDWGITTLARRVEALGPAACSHTGLVYAGVAGGASGESSASSALFDVLTLAGIAGEPGVRAGSIMRWAAVKLFDNNPANIARVARHLGVTRLDTAAKFIGWDWRGEAQ